MRNGKEKGDKVRSRVLFASTNARWGTSCGRERGGVGGSCMDELESCGV